MFNFEIRKQYLLLMILLSICLLPVASAQDFYDVNQIQKIEIYFSASNWDQQLDTSKSGADGYIMADSVFLNGQRIDSVGVKYKGNSSYNATYSKNPLHISLNEFKNQSYQGYKDVKLGNGYADPSMIREVLSYNLLKNYMDCPKSNFATLYINGLYIGIYANDESINKKFCSEHFNSSDNILIKCNPIINPGPNTKSNLKFINSDTTSYLNLYEIKSATGWKDLMALCDSVTNKPANSVSIIDWDRWLWMLAFNNAFVNLDSYSGVFAQNYYLYKDNSKHFCPIVWDLNMSFGGFPFLGNSNSSLGSLSITNMQQLALNIHATDSYWPIINAVQNDPVLKRKYVAHLRTIMKECVESGLYLTMANQYRSLIDSMVTQDANKFYTNIQFQNSLTASTVVGSYSVPGIQSLMDARLTFLKSNAEYTAVTPTIANVVATNAVYNSTIKIKTNVQQASTVILNYRLTIDDTFKQITMYDDGLHDDGAANDLTYGASFVMNALHAQYYIYAENSNAGQFSPERAAHEYYTLTAAFATAGKGDIRINEFLALNQADTVDEAGQHEDWIELYNTTGNTLNLFGLYLTDLYSTPTKYAFPQNTLIQPYSYLTVFADQDSSTAKYLHCNFKLSGSGEMIMLSDGNGAVSDSITFGVQTTDVSISRCPNGIGAFSPTTNTTFNASNCNIGGIHNHLKTEKYQLIPNPSSGSFRIQGKEIKSIVIYNTLGEKVFENSYDSLNEISIESLHLTSGIYLININEGIIMRLQMLN